MTESLRTPRAPLTMFDPNTEAIEACALIGASLIAMALSAPGLYITPSPIQGGPNTFNMDAMVRDAGNIAVQLQREIEKRQAPPEGV